MIEGSPPPTPEPVPLRHHCGTMESSDARLVRRGGMAITGTGLIQITGNPA
jgi:hypothetical protein